MESAWSQQYAAIEGLALAFNSPQQEPLMLEHVAVALERPGAGADAGAGAAPPQGAPPQPLATPAPPACQLAVYDRAGRQLAALRRRPPGPAQLLWDEALRLHFWSSGAGWWVLLRSEKARVAFLGEWHQLLGTGASLPCSAHSCRSVRCPCVRLCGTAPACRPRTMRPACTRCRLTMTIACSCFAPYASCPETVQRPQLAAALLAPPATLQAS